MSARIISFLVAVLCSAAAMVPVPASAQRFPKVEKEKPAPPTSCDQPTMLVDDAPSLAKLADLDCRRLAGSLTIESRGVESADLEELAGLESIVHDLTIRGVPSLRTLDGLSNLRIIGGALQIVGNENLESLEGLAGLEKAGGDVVIAYLPALDSLTGLGSVERVWGKLALVGNAKLTSLEGLETLQRVDGNMHLAYMPALTTLAGTPALQRVGQLTVEGLQRLTTLDGFAVLQRVGGNFEVLDNPRLNDIDEGLRPTHIGSYVVFKHNGALDRCEVDDLLEKSESPIADKKIFLEDVVSECGGER